ncbi:hypothetical protein Dip518_000444 [Parelusimicrobium proximum]|uniref:hypothetical protein n=1 Tax=Parelusimicrobium proximum TaxID=3228953 RepID=UPI003D16B0E0
MIKKILLTLAVAAFTLPCFAQGGGAFIIDKETGAIILHASEECSYEQYREYMIELIVYFEAEDPSARQKAVTIMNSCPQFRNDEIALDVLMQRDMIPKDEDFKFLLDQGLYIEPLTDKETGKDGVYEMLVECFQAGVKSGEGCNSSRIEMVIEEAARRGQKIDFNISNKEYPWVSSFMLANYFNFGRLAVLMSRHGAKHTDTEQYAFSYNLGDWTPVERLKSPLNKAVTKSLFNAWEQKNGRVHTFDSIEDLRALYIPADADALLIGEAHGLTLLDKEEFEHYTIPTKYEAAVKMILEGYKPKGLKTFASEFLFKYQKEQLDKFKQTGDLSVVTQAVGDSPYTYMDNKSKDILPSVREINIVGLESEGKVYGREIRNNRQLKRLGRRIERKSPEKYEEFRKRLAAEYDTDKRDSIWFKTIIPYLLDGKIAVYAGLNHVKYNSKRDNFKEKLDRAGRKTYVVSLVGGVNDYNIFCRYARNIGAQDINFVYYVPAQFRNFFGADLIVHFAQKGYWYDDFTDNILESIPDYSKDDTGEKAED